MSAVDLICTFHRPHCWCQMRCRASSRPLLWRPLFSSLQARLVRWAIEPTRTYRLSADGQQPRPENAPLSHPSTRRACGHNGCATSIAELQSRCRLNNYQLCVGSWGMVTAWRFVWRFRFFQEYRPGQRPIPNGCLGPKF